VRLLLVGGSGPVVSVGAAEVVVDGAGEPAGAADVCDAPASDPVHGDFCQVDL
jgi:hypothetical protein